MCEWHLRRFDSVEGSLWDKLFTADPQDSDGCAYALQQGDQTFTRLQHRINSTRRAFHTALKELERLEARDQDVVLVGPHPVSPVTQTPETQLQILGVSVKMTRATPPRRNAPGASPGTQVHRRIRFRYRRAGNCTWRHSRP